MDNIRLTINYGDTAYDIKIHKETDKKNAKSKTENGFLPPSGLHNIELTL